MAEVNQFGSANPAGSYGRGCLPFESMLVDSMDGTLSPEDQERFDAHLSTCLSCSEMLAGARRGAAWLELLHPFPPEPPADLVARILQQTSVQTALDAEAARREHQALRDSNALLGAPGAPAVTAPSALPSTPGRVLPFPARAMAQLRPAMAAVLQTRFAMTAAMAFFSVALTLNLTGVQVSRLHARDLRPSNLRRGLYEANARVVRYYESFRVVYELESRVRDLQHSSAEDTSTQEAAPAPAANQQQTAPEGSAPAGSGSPAPSGKAPQRNPPRSSNPATSDRSGRDDHQALEPGSAVDPHHKQPSTRELAPASPVLAVLWPEHVPHRHNTSGGKGVLA